MQLSEIIEKEKQRNDTELCRKAYLYREGKFLRAYEWSAWLFVKYVNDFKVTTRQSKAAEQPVSMIGFPLTSMDKFTPTGAFVEPQTDGSIVLALPLEAIPDDVDVKLLASEFAQWKMQQPISESKKEKKDIERESFDDEDFHLSHRVTLSSVMQHILAYPLERKSPMECVEFISDLKRQLASLI